MSHNVLPTIAEDLQSHCCCSDMAGNWRWCYVPTFNKMSAKALLKSSLLHLECNPCKTVMLSWTIMLSCTYSRWCCVRHVGKKLKDHEGLAGTVHLVTNCCMHGHAAVCLCVCGCAHACCTRCLHARCGETAF